MVGFRFSWQKVIIRSCRLQWCKVGVSWDNVIHRRRHIFSLFFSSTHISVMYSLSSCFSPNFPTLCQQIHLCTNHVIIAVSQYQHHRLYNCCCASEHISTQPDNLVSHEILRVKQQQTVIDEMHDNCLCIVHVLTDIVLIM